MPTPSTALRSSAQYTDWRTGQQRPTGYSPTATAGSGVSPRGPARTTPVTYNPSVSTPSGATPVAGSTALGASPFSANVTPQGLAADQAAPPVTGGVIRPEAPGAGIEAPSGGGSMEALMGGGGAVGPAPTLAEPAALARPGIGQRIPASMAQLLRA